MPCIDAYKCNINSTRQHQVRLSSSRQHQVHTAQASEQLDSVNMRCQSQISSSSSITGVL
eukprot:2937125-Amphidinium_carterae.1